MDTPPPAGSAPAALKAVVAELELHADATGWDRPPTLYALVDTAELIAAEPTLATQLGLTPETVTPGTLTPVEQEPLGDLPLDEALARIAWPETVLGCALVQEVVVLPPGAEKEQPDGVDPMAWASGHAERREVRMTVAVLRDGARAAALRLRPTGPDDKAEAAFGENLAPNLAEALLATLH
jgi:hypothetical protein